MGALVLPRQALPARVVHPDHLRLRGFDVTLVEDDGRLAKGDTILGWRGDPTLAMYVCFRPVPGWHLVKLCADGKYRLLKSLDAHPNSGVGVSGNDAVGLFVAWLIDTDPQRGVDVSAQIDAHNEQVVADREQALAEYVEGEVAPRFVHALDKELGLDLDGRIHAVDGFGHRP